MLFGPENKNNQGWGMGTPIDQISPSALSFGGAPALSFNQGSLATPIVDTNQLVQVPKVGRGGAASGLSGMDKANIALGGLQTIGSLFMVFQANKLAKKQFRFQKDFANQNLANSIKSYNTALEDRIRSRSFTEGRASGYADDYINKNKMEDKRVG